MDNGAGVQVIEENNYYPFGLKHEGYNGLTGNPSYQYKYNGKELQTETGMYDYGARFYMPDIGRWGVVDPLAEKYRRFSPYAYAVDNPILFTDPDGRDWGLRIDHKNKTITIEGNYYYQNQDSYDKNKNALTAWNKLAATYTSDDGVEYAVSFDLKGSVAAEGQKVDELAAADPIGNSVKELSDTGYNNWFSAIAGADAAEEHANNQGGGGTKAGKYIANKSSVANDKTRAHEMGHTFGQGENDGGVMNYADSYDKMSNPNYSNTKSIFNDVYKRVKSGHNLNTDGTSASGTVGKSKFRIIVTGDYSGKGNFLKQKSLKEKNEL